jgi:hippurate hydrolase
VLGRRLDGVVLEELASIYTDLHRHPELSMGEERTAGIAADYAETLGYRVTRGVGTTGVVAVLEHGAGPTVMMRADMDALPMKEETGLAYSSAAAGVAHSCGHDMHVAWMLGAARVLAESRSSWRVTAMLVFQPGEETAQGAAAMLDDWGEGRFPKPDVVLAQHVMVGAAGTVQYRPGVVLSAGDSLEITLFGRGSHGSQPHTSIDPVVMAAAVVLRLQTIVSREVAPTEPAVLTVGSLQAGTKENIIPDEATLKLNVRTYSEDARAAILRSIERICRAEAEASGAEKPPRLTPINRYPLTENDPAATETVAAALRAELGDAVLVAPQPASASEDFSAFGRAWSVPYVFWFVGGTDPAAYAQAVRDKALSRIPSNHSPRFAPVIHPTLETGVRAMAAAARAWLGAAGEPAREGERR